MFAHTSGSFLTLSLCSGPCLGAPSAGIAEVLDPKGLKKGMNKTGHTKGLSHSGRAWQNAYREGQQADDQLARFYFSQQALYKRGRDLNIKTLWPSYNLSVFAILYFYCQCPWLNINFFSVKGIHLALLYMVPLQILTSVECCIWRLLYPDRFFNSYFMVYFCHERVFSLFQVVLYFLYTLRWSRTFYPSLFEYGILSLIEFCTLSYV
jgi:hypothetical protein